MKSSNVIDLLRDGLPSYTGDFDTTLSITSLVASAGVATATTSAAHGQTTGSVVTIQGAKSPLVITSLTQVDGVATAVTASGHDLTTGDQTTVEVVDAADSEYNGATLTLLEIVSRTSFTYTVDSGAPASTTGASMLETLEIGYNGAVTVASAPTATTFTYALSSSTPDTLGSPARGTITASTGYRIARAGSLEEAQEVYSQRTENEASPEDTSWAFVILGPVVTNKDRNVQNDTQYTVSIGDQYRQRLIENFSVFVFIPRIKSLELGAIRDSIQDLRIAMVGTLCGKPQGGGFSNGDEYRIVYVQDTSSSVDRATYIHQFEFQTSYDVTDSDVNRSTGSVAFRKFSLFLDAELPNGDTDGISTTDVELAP